MQKYASKVPREAEALTKQWVFPNRMFQSPATRAFMLFYAKKQASKKASTDLCGWPPPHCLSPVIECTGQFCGCQCWKNNDQGPLTSAALDLKPPHSGFLSINLTSRSLTEIILILSSGDRIMPPCWAELGLSVGFAVFSWFSRPCAAVFHRAQLDLLYVRAHVGRNMMVFHSEKQLSYKWESILGK